MRKRSSAWREALRDRDVSDWYETMGNSGTGTADERLRVLFRYCRAKDTTPHELLVRTRADGLAMGQEFQRFVNMMKRPHAPSVHGEDDRNPQAVKRCEKGHAGGYIKNFDKALRGWLAHNGLAMRKIVIGDTDATPTTEDERVPTPDELRNDVLPAADRRTKVSIVMEAWSGLRLQVQGKEKAQDGLRIGDLPEMKIEGKTVTFTKVPTRIHVRRELSKVRKKYDTFLPDEGCLYVKEELEHRLACGEDLTKDSAVVAPERGYEDMGRRGKIRGSRFLETQAISKAIRTCHRNAGLKARPYVWRSYFVSALASAEREKKITQLDREFFEGRKGAISARYSVNKELPARVIEEMRTEFAACEPYLTGHRAKRSGRENAEQIAHAFVGLMTDIAKKGASLRPEEFAVEAGNFAHTFEQMGAEIRRITKSATSK